MYVCIVTFTRVCVKKRWCYNMKERERRKLNEHNQRQQQQINKNKANHTISKS